MKYTDEVKDIIKDAGWTISDVARIIFMDDKDNPVQALMNKFARDTLRYSEAKEIAEAIGYKLEWVSKSIKESIYHDDDISKPVPHEKQEPRWDFGDYAGKDIEQVFLHSVKRHAAYRKISQEEMFMRIIHHISMEFAQMVSDEERTGRIQRPTVKQSRPNREEPTD